MSTDMYFGCDFANVILVYLVLCNIFGSKYDWKLPKED